MRTCEKKTPFHIKSVIDTSFCKLLRRSYSFYAHALFSAIWDDNTFSSFFWRTYSHSDRIRNDILPFKFRIIASGCIHFSLREHTNRHYLPDKKLCFTPYRLYLSFFKSSSFFCLKTTMIQVITPKM